MQVIQQFSIDSEIPLSDALKMPFWFLTDFYSGGAWKIKKDDKAIRDQITINVLQQLENTQINLKNIQVALGNLR